MSSVDLEHEKHEIIIVKRGHDEHDDHHGGVWKIAFADFMTAMMCFFLVMWLINAANEQTKAAVASYFNPVKLIDRNSSRKGLEDVGDGPNSSGLSPEVQQEANAKAGSEGNGNAGPATTDESAQQQSAAPAESKDDHLFADPYAVLAEIATDTQDQQNLSAKGDGGAQLSGPATGASGGESYRDPFAPDFWTQQVAEPDAAETSAERAKAEEETAEIKPEDQAILDELAGKKPEPAKGEAPAGELKAGEQPEGEKAGPGEKVAEKPADTAPTPEAVKTAEDIKQELDQTLAQDKTHDGIEVTATDKGVVISVTDQLDFGMFEVGSAVPRRDLVLAMEKIGHTLGEKHGTISINGHTDGRPFRNATYDNWRLSSARAQSAYYMLVRGGLDEKRITQVAGFADRKLKDPAAPFAASNRRIEILLEMPR